VIWLPWIAFFVIIASMVIAGFKSKRNFLPRLAGERGIAEEQKKKQEQEFGEMRAQQQMILDELKKRERQTTNPSPAQGFTGDLSAALGGKMSTEAKPN
jgi:hypothetical protein